MSVNGTTPYTPKVLSSLAAWKERTKRSRPIHSVAIPEFTLPGEDEVIVLMQAMSGTQRENWGLRQIADESYEPDEELRKERDRQKTYGQMLKGSKVSLVAASVVDEEGRPIFEASDVAEIGEANAAGLERLYAKAVQLNGLSRNAIPDYLLKWLEQDEVAAPPQPDLETRVKNSKSGLSDASSVA